jgi:hypothetical protein
VFEHETEIERELRAVRQAALEKRASEMDESEAALREETRLIRPRSEFHAEQPFCLAEVSRRVLGKVVHYGVDRQQRQQIAGENGANPECVLLDCGEPQRDDMQSNFRDRARRLARSLAGSRPEATAGHRALSRYRSHALLRRLCR